MESDLVKNYDKTECSYHWMLKKRRIWRKKANDGKKKKGKRYGNWWDDNDKTECWSLNVERKLPRYEKKSISLNHIFECWKKDKKNGICKKTKK